MTVQPAKSVSLCCQGGLQKPPRVSPVSPDVRRERAPELSTSSCLVLLLQDSTSLCHTLILTGAPDETKLN